MMTRRAPCALSVAIVVLAGCSDESKTPDADAGSADAGEIDCTWPIEESTLGGTIELGTGATGFEPMPDELQFVMGTQSGTFLIVHARINGLEPGNLDDFRDPVNPRTRFSATLWDGTLVGRECPSTQAYKPSEEAGWYERKTFQNLEFLPFEVGEKAFDTMVKLRVEVIDSNGRYSSDEKDVLCHAPVGWADAGVDGGVQPDAGAGADASADLSHG
jgi:hypothetical protein